MSRPQSPSLHPPPYVDSNFVVHDWTSFFHPQDFEAPKAEDGIDAFAHRLSQNFSGFFGNYVIVCGMCIVFACIAEPTLIIGIGLVATMFRYRDTELPLIASVCLSLLLAGGTTFIWSIFVGVAVILVHSMLHLPVQPLHEPPPPPATAFGAVGAEVRSAWSSAASILVGQAMGLRQRIAASFNNSPQAASFDASAFIDEPRGRTPPPPPPQAKRIRQSVPSRVRTEPYRHMPMSQHTYHTRDNSTYEYDPDCRECNMSPPPPPTTSLASASMDFLRRRRREEVVPMQPLHEE